MMDAKRQVTPIVKIILVEDHVLVRQGTRRILEEHQELSVIGEADSGEQGLEMARRLRPDVAVVDIRLPGMSGVEMIRELRRVSPQTRMLVLSAYDDDEYVLAMMGEGVSGYMLKTAEANELVEAVCSVAMGKDVLHPDIAIKVARLWARRRMLSQEAVGLLSHREMEVLRLAAKGLSAKAIACNLGISARTVNDHFRSIFHKLGVSSRLKAVLRALSLHLVTSEETKWKPADQQVPSPE